ncbi:Fur family transcriptional regulator [Paenibacillus sp. J31TS4]|uniref:Fur family transcriptional regulator n=1 Tax=Paenibacillus sp. J31TS4 TaxID=2807195 RepID=UPI001BCE5C68|nr:Fur family transcriptional regulator [Paenibacillus sp. J31TS4]
MTNRLEQALGKLKHSGVRMTPQRYAILSHLLNATSHPTADDIYRALEDKFPNMSVATVYNNLKVFIETGLVRELTFGDNSSRFDADMSSHYHAQCDQCGKIVDFHFPTLTEIEHTAAVETGFQVRGHRLDVHGVCKDCQSRMTH